MTDEQIKQGLECCTSHNGIYVGVNCLACPYKDKIACKDKLRKDLLKCLNAETQLKELLSALYQRTGEKGFTIYRKDIVELANDYGIKEEELG